MSADEHLKGIDEVLAARKSERRQFNSIELYAQHERLRFGFRARIVLILLLAPLALVVLSIGGGGLAIAVVIATLLYKLSKWRPRQKSPIDPASDRLWPPDWPGRCCQIVSLVCFAILFGMIGGFIPLEFAIRSTRTALAERGLTIAPSEAETLLTFGLMPVLFGLEMWHRPESRKSLALCLMMWSAFFLWNEWERFETQNASALSRVGMLVTEHLESHDGRWPESWEDLKKAHNALEHRYGRSWNLEELRARVEVDFGVDPERLVQGKPGTGGPMPFEVISLRPRWKTARDEDFRDPNRAIFDYLRRKSQPNGDRSFD